jgi:hypothetical protein
MNPGLKARVKEGRDGVSTPPLFPAGKNPGLKAEVSLASMKFWNRIRNRESFCGRFYGWKDIAANKRCPFGALEKNW